jgi:uncharacterized membrane protein YkoI
MMKKTMATIVVVVAIIGLAFAVYGNPNSKDSTNISNSSDKQNTVVNSTNNNTTSTSTSKNVISSAEAKKIATKYINQTGALAGTPELVNQDGKSVYIVPVIYNGKTAGEIDIDALTGQNLGGAGGVQ